MTAQRQSLGRIPTELAAGQIFGNALEEDAPFPDRPDVLSLYPRSDDPGFMLAEALKRDLSAVERLRFDPVNVCNLRCVFCPHDLERRFAALPLDLFREVLVAIAGRCRRINIGCAFEPTMCKNLGDYFRVITEVAAADFITPPIVSMLTNGLMLERHDLTPILPLLGWLHVSCHSHRAEIFERIETRASFARLETNLRQVRERYPGLRLHIEHVVSSHNAADVAGFIDWAFGDIGADTLNIRRADIEMPRKANSPLAATLAAGEHLGLDDNAWQSLVDAISTRFPAVRGAITTAPGRVTDVLELSLADMSASTERT